MSSTNRSNAREKHVADYYVTPVNEIKNFLDNFTKDEGINLSTMEILDPCAGGDLENNMSYPEALDNIKVVTVDIREDSLASCIGDYRELTLFNKFDIIITNPPFNIALEIIQKALYDVKDGGYVIMLLRLNYFGSKSRYDFWKNNMPKYAYIHHKRMSFNKEGGTDSIEYMHCVWKKGDNPEFTKLKII